MTCIVGIAEGGRVYLGGDSAGVAGYQITVRADAKVFSVGPYIMGFTTSFRMGQLLHHTFKPPKPKGNLDRFMVAEFIPAVMDCLDDGGWLNTENGRRDGGTFLVGLGGRLFVIYDDFQVGDSTDGYDAVGCGADIAFGSLHTSKGRSTPLRWCRRPVRHQDFRSRMRQADSTTATPQ
jgi:hypothetical protein